MLQAGLMDGWCIMVKAARNGLHGLNDVLAIVGVMK